MVLKSWESRSGIELFKGGVPPGPEFLSVAYDPQGGNYIISGRADGTIQVWDAATGELRKTLTHGDMVRGLAFSKNGRRLASLSLDGVVKVWPWDSALVADPGWIPAARTLAVRALVPGPCSNISFSPEGRLAVGVEDNTVQIWDLEADRSIVTLRGHSDDVYAVVFSPDGRWIATAGADSTVKVWDSRAGGKPVRTFRGHTGVVTSLAFAQGGQRLISGSRDHTVKTWDLTPLNATSGQ
jgi:WD40 repeat protein